MHIPVLQKEVLDILSPSPQGLYLDGTLGFGGHAKSLLTANSSCQICGLDRDIFALNTARENLCPFDERIKFFNLTFSEFPSALNQLGWQLIDGALLDLGVSSYQLDTSERGFSFSHNGPLDMRMGYGCKKTAAEIVNSSSLEELEELISFYGEEPLANRIAKAIIFERIREPIMTTSRLANIVIQAYPPKWRKTARNHPATRTFQALRIVVNNELGELEKFLHLILSRLKIGGRLAIINFHSLEDRMIKKTLRKWAKKPISSPYNQILLPDKPEVKILFKKPVMASEKEIIVNPRARSAKLRAIEKIGEANDTIQTNHNA